MSPYRLKGTAGPVINQTWDLGERLLIGGGAPGAVPLEAADGEAPGSGEPVAELSFDGRRIVLRRRVDDAAVQVNGRAVTEAELGGGDEIRVGACRFIVQAPGLRPERVLTEDAVRPRRSPWPWVVVALVVLAALAVTGWQLGWFDAWLPPPQD